MFKLVTIFSVLMSSFSFAQSTQTFTSTEVGLKGFAKAVENSPETSIEQQIIYLPIELEVAQSSNALAATVDELKATLIQVSMKMAQETLLGSTQVTGELATFEVHRIFAERGVVFAEQFYPIKLDISQVKRVGKNITVKVGAYLGVAMNVANNRNLSDTAINNFESFAQEVCGDCNGYSNESLNSAFVNVNASVDMNLVKIRIFAQANTYRTALTSRGNLNSIHGSNSLAERQIGLRVDVNPFKNRNVGFFSQVEYTRVQQTVHANEYIYSSNQFEATRKGNSQKTTLSNNTFPIISVGVRFGL